jgi:hypothetical protein
VCSVLIAFGDYDSPIGTRHNALFSFAFFGAYDECSVGFWHARSLSTDFNVTLWASAIERQCPPDLLPHGIVFCITIANVMCQPFSNAMSPVIANLPHGIAFCITITHVMFQSFSTAIAHVIAFIEHRSQRYYVISQRQRQRQRQTERQRQRQRRRQRRRQRQRQRERQRPSRLPRKLRG